MQPLLILSPLLGTPEKVYVATFDFIPLGTPAKAGNNVSGDHYGMISNVVFGVTRR